MLLFICDRLISSLIGSCRSYLFSMDIELIHSKRRRRSSNDFIEFQSIWLTRSLSLSIFYVTHSSLILSRDPMSSFIGWYWLLDLLPLLVQGFTSLHPHKRLCPRLLLQLTSTPINRLFVSKYENLLKAHVCFCL